MRRNNQRELYICKYLLFCLQVAPRLLVVVSPYFRFLYYFNIIVYFWLFQSSIITLFILKIWNLIPQHSLQRNMLIYTAKQPAYILLWLIFSVFVHYYQNICATSSQYHRENLECAKSKSSFTLLCIYCLNVVQGMSPRLEGSYI
jgi:hypothetical protein